MLLGVLTVQLVVAAAMLVEIPAWMGHDFTVYRNAAERFVEGQGYFLPYQLSGPYPVVADEVLYPPFALALFVPFVWLPAPLFVLIPLTVLALTIRPSLWVLFLLTFPQVRPMSWAMDLVGNGNPVLWVAMFVALARRYPVFGPFAWLKPTPVLLPFGLTGFPRRQWFVGLAVLVALSALVLPMWPQYATVLLNARGAGLLYGLTGVPLVLIPVVAMLGSVEADVLPFGRTAERGEIDGVEGDAGVDSGDVGAPRRRRAHDVLGVLEVDVRR